MAASSSGGNNDAMEVGSEHEEEATEENLLQASNFEEFLRRHRQDESMQTQAQASHSQSQLQPGNVEVDESPLKPSLTRNKESLKLKLQMRRPINQLVEQGILPSPSTPPAYACQRVKLERARMGDLLKAKIQQRPSRQELVRQHILEETDPRVAPLLAEKQRMLKRARLADSLNDHLIHRPGPLELVQKNILHAPDESIEKAIKEGIVPFKATCEGATPGPPLPTKYICTEDDSSSDVSSPSVNLDSVPSEESADIIPVLPDTSVPESVVEVQNKSSIPISTIVPPPPPPPPPFPFTISEVQASTIAQNVGIFAVPIYTPTPQQIMSHQQPVYPASQQSSSGSSSSSMKSRSKKLSKSKSQSKKFQIKFHEYKGPPNAQKSAVTAAEQKRPPESSYELLLQQQQLFLQWQLEYRNRFPKILLPAMTPEEKKAFCSTLQASSSSFPATVSHHNHPVVSDSLPVQIISNPSNSVLILSSTEPSHVNNTHQTLTYVPPQQPAQTPATLIITTPVTSQPSTTETPANTTNSVVRSEKAVEVKGIPKLNDWKVNELKVELKKRNLPVSGSKSQLVERLQASYLKSSENESKNNETDVKPLEVKKEVITASPAPPVAAPQHTELTFFLTSNNSTTLLSPSTLKFLQTSGILKAGVENKETPSNSTCTEGQQVVQPTSRSVLQQKIQQKLQQQQQAKTQLNTELNPLLQTVNIEPADIVVVNDAKSWMPTTSSTTLLPEKSSNEQILKTCAVGTSDVKIEPQLQSEDPWVLKITESNPSFENCLADLLSGAESPQPATIHHRIDSTLDPNVKSQMVDDVLEILIRNGELPASAAQHIVASQQSSSQQGKIPPAPPLPPTTFAITLPTEISYRRLSQPHVHEENTIVPGRKGSLLGITSLTKEAADILKISEELATFSGKPANQEEHFLHHPHNIKKEEELMELEDHQMPNLEMKANKSLINGDSMVDELLLNSPLEFPMDTEYSDWLESFSSDNTFNNFNNHKIDKSRQNEDAHHRDPLLSSNLSKSSNRILDNNFPSTAVVDNSGNSLMDIDSNPNNTTETDLLKIRKAEDTVNLNNVNDLWDFSF